MEGEVSEDGGSTVFNVGDRVKPKREKKIGVIQAIEGTRAFVAWDALPESSEGGDAPVKKKRRKPVDLKNLEPVGTKSAKIKLEHCSFTSQQQRALQTAEAVQHVWSCDDARTAESVLHGLGLTLGQLAQPGTKWVSRNSKTHGPKKHGPFLLRFALGAACLAPSCFVVLPAPH